MKKANRGLIVVSEIRNTGIGLRFKGIVTKECKPISVQLQVYSSEDQRKGMEELRL